MNVTTKTTTERLIESGWKACTPQEENIEQWMIVYKQGFVSLQSKYQYNADDDDVLIHIGNDICGMSLSEILLTKQGWNSMIVKQPQFGQEILYMITNKLSRSRGETNFISNGIYDQFLRDWSIQKSDICITTWKEC